MSFDLKACVVSIRHQKNRDRIVGSGFVVAEDRVLTCAHVVAAAGAGPGDTLRLYYATTGDFAAAEALADYYRAPEREDMALLALAAPLPDGVMIAPLAPTTRMRKEHGRFAPTATIPWTKRCPPPTPMATSWATSPTPPASPCCN